VDSCCHSYVVTRQPESSVIQQRQSRSVLLTPEAVQLLLRDCRGCLLAGDGSLRGCFELGVQLEAGLGWLVLLS
jgi:hypothetical protein